MHKDDMTQDVRGKLILETTAAVQEVFGVTESISVVIMGLILKEKEFIPTKDAIQYLKGIMKTPVGYLDQQQQELRYYLEHKNVSGN